MNQYLVSELKSSPVDQHAATKVPATWAHKTFDRRDEPTYHAPAMANPLFEYAAPVELARRRQTIDLKGRVVDFQRLVEIVEAELADVERSSRPANWQDSTVLIKLDFGFFDSQQQQPLVSGIVKTRLAVRCQRCLEPFLLPLQTDLDMLMIERGDNWKGADSQEVWEYEPGAFRPGDLVEESLVMALPLAAMHQESEECAATNSTVVDEAKDTVRPFADLRSQMNKMN